MNNNFTGKLKAQKVCVIYLSVQRTIAITKFCGQLTN